MAKYLSIGDRLRSARSPEAIRATVTDWSEAWRKEQMEIVALIDDATDRMDRVALRSAAGQLHEITTKRFDGLAGVIRRLTSNT